MTKTTLTIAALALLATSGIASAEAANRHVRAPQAERGLLNSFGAISEDGTVRYDRRASDQIRRDLGDNSMDPWVRSSAN